MTALMIIYKFLAKNKKQKNHIKSIFGQDDFKDSSEAKSIHNDHIQDVFKQFLPKSQHFHQDQL